VDIAFAPLIGGFINAEADRAQLDHRVVEVIDQETDRSLRRAHPARRGNGKRRPVWKSEEVRLDLRHLHFLQAHILAQEGAHLTALFGRCTGKNQPSYVHDRCRSMAATSSGVAGRTDGHAIAFSKQTNCFSWPSARATDSFLDRRTPPRKQRLKECSPGETWYTLACVGEMAPMFEPSMKTLTTPPSPISGPRR
jgi:hypothetical protein